MAVSPVSSPGVAAATQIDNGWQRSRVEGGYVEFNPITKQTQFVPDEPPEAKAVSPAAVAPAAAETAPAVAPVAAARPAARPAKRQRQRTSAAAKRSSATTSTSRPKRNRNTGWREKRDKERLEKEAQSASRRDR